MSNLPVAHKPLWFKRNLMLLGGVTKQGCLLGVKRFSTGVNVDDKVNNGVNVVGEDKGVGREVFVNDEEIGVGSRPFLMSF